MTEEKITEIFNRVACENQITIDKLLVIFAHAIAAEAVAEEKVRKSKTHAK